MNNVRTLVVILSMLTMSAQAAHDCCKREEVLFLMPQEAKKTRYTEAMLKGAGIGALTGTWCALADSMTNHAFFPVTWFLSFTGRKALLDPVLDDYDDNEVLVYRDTIDTSAWLSSWASYITALSLFDLYRKGR